MENDPSAVIAAVAHLEAESEAEARRDTEPSPADHSSMSIRELLMAILDEQHGIRVELRGTVSRLELAERELTQTGHQLSDAVHTMGIMIRTVQEQGLVLERMRQEHTVNHGGVKLVPPLGESHGPTSGTL